MPPPLGALLSQPGDYELEHVTMLHTDECFMCKEPYIQPGNSSDEGCRAIRLKFCGHIIGDDCFRRWIQSHAGTCPCWNHTLPARADTKMTSTALLSKSCASCWFNLTEEIVLEARLDDYTFASALRALQDGRLGLLHACYLAAWYSVFGLLVSVLFAFMIWSCAAIVAFGFFLLHALLAGLAKPPICLGRGCTVWLFMPLLGKVSLALIVPVAMYTVLFASVVLAVLSLGLWRSFVRRCKNMWAHGLPSKRA